MSSGSNTKLESLRTPPPKHGRIMPTLIAHSLQRFYLSRPLACGPALARHDDATGGNEIAVTSEGAAEHEGTIATCDAICATDSPPVA